METEPRLRIKSLEVSSEQALAVSFVEELDNSSGYVFTCRNCREYKVDSSQSSLMRSEIQLKDEDLLLWDYGPQSNIFGNAPLPDPPRFFWEFFELIRFKFEGKRDPSKYLNWKTNLREWRTFVYSRSYNLLTAPALLIEEITPLLDVQAAEYMVLPADKPDSEQAEANREVPKALVFGNSWVVADAFEVEELSL